MLLSANTTINRYGSIAAEIYDLDKPFGALPDTAFHLEALAGVEGPILEPACGSGRTLVPLLQAGHDLTGFDPSEEMLDRCRARCAERGFSPPLSRQRFEDFNYPSPFAAILVPVGSFTLIDDFDTALAVLRRFHAHLVVGGLLLLDIQPLAFLAASGEDRRRWTAENGDLLTLEGKRTAADWLAQRGESLLRYERWRDNRLVETQLEPMAQRYWGLGEFSLALEATGFSLEAVTGGYARGRPPRASDRVLTFEARKKA
ncbi:class I SAM-dependent methyltransferase [Phenylobacterium montanum]|uniref:Class I SAM-dependent methyltransferase n=1 Tax=Phenylobacterium montanum TaxID=2823693 RepID=A0A975FVF8_9CAUL|nr:class I SAM-dependent methyltransferase [Caulobacter sp. S6]QUD86120.1 class I SAM-dependent methyltransferase [Caulobacter sp. S6]